MIRHATSQESPEWRCPGCRGALDALHDAYACRSCGERFPCIGGPPHTGTAGGIPDFRLERRAKVDLRADRERADRLLADIEGRGTEAAVRCVFASRAHWTSHQVDARTREVLGAPSRLAGDLRGWLRPAIEAPGLLLDVGCGPGGLLAAAAGRDAPAAGIDTSLEWLVVARVLLREHGARARVAAGQAEALPLQDGAVGAAVSLDVIEHVQRPAGMLAEIDRVVASAGVLCFSTPNRFSLAAEPHVGVWGVGFLPRPLQPAYVQWRRGDPYDGTTLLSGTEIRRLLAETDFDLGLETPPIPAENLAAFSPRRAALGRAYNRLITWPALRPVWLRVAPFFRATCRKNGAAPARTRVP